MKSLRKPRNYCFAPLKTVAALIITSLLLCACSTPAPTDNAISAVEPPQTESGISSIDYDSLDSGDWLATLKTVDYKGYPFTIATSKGSRFEPDEEMSGMVNPLLQKRNELIEEKYNITVREVLGDEAELIRSIRTATSAGMQYCDLISLSTGAIAALAYDGCLSNLYSLPGFDETAIYVDAGMVAAASAGRYLYTLYDRISFFQEDCWCVFYNEELLPSGASGTISKAVNDGSWTWDMLDSFAREAAREVMEKRSPDNRMDTFGLASYADRDSMTLAMFASSGLKVLGDTQFTKLSFRLDPKTGNDAADKIRELLDSKYYLSLTGEDASEAFLEGRSAFFTYSIDYARAASEADFRWGIAPLPKLSGTQEGYFSYLSQASAGVSASANQLDSARTGTLLTALCASSYMTLESALISNYVTFFLRDNESAKMLKSIFDSPATDIGSLYGSGFNRLSYVTTETILEAVNENVSFAYAFMNRAGTLDVLNENEFR